MKWKDEILKLGKQGYSYRKIQEILGCSKGTICFHLGEGQKEKNYLRSKKRHPYVKKYEAYIARINTNFNLTNDRKWAHAMANKVIDFAQGKTEFTYHDIIKRDGENPVCYLTGEKIDIKKTRSFHFDHKIPKSKGGDNSLSNLGIASKKANMAKSDCTVEEFIELCKQVLEHNGYKVEKN